MWGRDEPNHMSQRGMMVRCCEGGKLEHRRNWIALQPLTDGVDGAVALSALIFWVNRPTLVVRLN